MEVTNSPVHILPPDAFKAGLWIMIIQTMATVNTMRTMYIDGKATPTT